MGLRDEPMEAVERPSGVATTRQALSRERKALNRRRKIGRNYFYSGPAGALISTMAFTAVFPGVNAAPAAILGFAGGLWIVHARQKRHERLVAEQEATRAYDMLEQQRAEAEKQIAEARKSGAFDRWEQK